MEKKEKKQLIAKAIEIFVQNGYCIEEFIGKPMSWFDYEKLKKWVKENEQKI